MDFLDTAAADGVADVFSVMAYDRNTGDDVFSDDVIDTAAADGVVNVFVNAVIDTGADADGVSYCNWI